LIRFAYTGKGLYSEQIQRYFNYFPKENFLFFLFEEDIKKNIGATITKIEEFLGLNPYSDYNFDMHSNQAYTPNVIWINRFFSQKSKTKTFIKKAMPLGFLRKIKSKVKNANKGESKGFYNPDEDMLTYLYDYFKEDMAKLPSLIDRDISCWQRNPDEV